MRIGDSDDTELNDLLESFRASLKAEKELLITAQSNSNTLLLRVQRQFELTNKKREEKIIIVNRTKESANLSEYDLEYTLKHMRE